MRAIEIFAGCGGMAHGLRQAGIEHVLLVEKCQFCVDTLNANGFENTVCSTTNDIDFIYASNILCKIVTVL